MITNKKPVQTCDMDRHKVHETLIKLIPLSTKTAHKMILIGIKKFPERAILMKKCAKNRKYSRTGYFVRKS